MRALIVDDSKAMRAILGLSLRGAGFQTSEAGHGLEGLRILREDGPFDLVLVDWNMPEMDGLSFVRAVRGEGGGDSAGVRLMVVSSETEASRVSEAIASGADDYLTKPFTREALLARLERLGFGAAVR